MSTPPHERRPAAEVRQDEAPADPSGPDQVFGFGGYRFFPARRLLLEGEQLVRLGSRAHEILLTLLQNRGQVVSKETLIARAWPDTFVDEGNVRVQVAALRRALNDGRKGQRYIVATPGRGYTFTAPVTLSEAAPSASFNRFPESPRQVGLPAVPTRIIGRSEPLEAIAAQLVAGRFVTVVGPGGIGKTTVAVAAARDAARLHEHGVVFLDLSTVADPSLVPSGLVAALGLTAQSRNPLPTIAAFLAHRNMLLVVDNCEHVIEAAAALVENVLDAAPAIRVLATSREPLRAASERVHRLDPLASPSAGMGGISAAEALTYPGVELFVERAGELLGSYTLRDEDADLVAEICRSLDGIALAIELAARRVDAVGLVDLSAQLSDRFRFLTAGRRTALPRHRTLEATLDWSYQLLPAVEQELLRRLAVFAGHFSLLDASAIAPATSLDLDRSAKAWRTALRLAERHGDVDYQLRALAALWVDRQNNADFRAALALAERFSALAAVGSDPADRLVGERMAGATLHYLGDQAGSRERIERMLKRYVPPGRRSHAVRFQFHHS